MCVPLCVQAVRGEAGQPPAEGSEPHGVVQTDSGQPQPGDGVGQTLSAAPPGPHHVRYAALIHTVTGPHHVR